jgi:hypothetical protein
LADDQAGEEGLLPVVKVVWRLGCPQLDPQAHGEVVLVWREHHHDLVSLRGCDPSTLDRGLDKLNQRLTAFVLNRPVDE